jgi:hypothetical protein
MNLNIVRYHMYNKLASMQAIYATSYGLSIRGREPTQEEELSRNVLLNVLDESAAAHDECSGNKTLKISLANGGVVTGNFTAFNEAGVARRRIVDFKGKDVGGLDDLQVQYAKSPSSEKWVPMAAFINGKPYQDRASMVRAERTMIGYLIDVTSMHRCCPS